MKEQRVRIHYLHQHRYARVLLYLASMDKQMQRLAPPRVQVLCLRRHQKVALTGLRAQLHPISAARRHSLQLC